jgi:hypothetical protein
MNPPNDSRGGQPSQHPRSEDAKASMSKTQTLLRIFIVVALGSFFVYQLDISYLWLSAILTAAAIVLGIMVLVRAVRLKESKLVLFGAISGLAVAAMQVLLLLTSALFFTQVRDYQRCIDHALTERAASQCKTQLDEAMPYQLGQN